MEDFDTIADKNIDIVYRVAMSYCKNKYDAEDVVQNVFMKLIQSGVEFNDELHIRKWLVKVTVNECKNLWKSFWRRKVSSIDAIDEKPEFTTDDKSELYYAVMNLSSKYRIVIHLYYYEGYSVKEISEIIGIKETTIQTRLMRARKELKEQLKEAWQ